MPAGRRWRQLLGAVGSFFEGGLLLGIGAAEAIIAQWGVELTGITQSLDTVFALTENPQLLYDALPEGLKLQFVQTVFEKIWVLGNGVVGGDLSEPFSELLTLEAQLVLAKGREGATADDELETSHGGATYHRFRVPLTVPLQAPSSWGQWLTVERPRGPLPVDKQNPGRHRGRGSNVHHLVEYVQTEWNLISVELFRWNQATA